MDNGIWAVWYDLPEGDNSDYFDWLHGAYLPALRARPGFLWSAHYEAVGAESEMMSGLRGSLARAEDGSVGTGTRYLMLAGAAELSTLVAPSVIDEPADPAALAMLSRRVGQRPCLLAAVARVDGPHMGQRPPGTTPGPVIQMGTFRTRTVADEYDVCAWYAQHRLPAIAHMDGCIAARVMMCAGWAKFSVLYEFTSLDARRGHFEDKQEALGLDETSWTRRIHDYTVHAPGSPMVATRLWPPVEG